MQSEIDSMYLNQAWTLVDLLKGIFTIRCKQIFKKKIGVNDKVTTYKTKLAVKGYNLKEEIDYDMTSLIALIRSLQILLVVDVHLDYEIQQIDVKTTFLNGFFVEDIYVVQPCGT